MEELAINLALKSALPVEAIDQTTVNMTIIWVDFQERPDLAELSARYGKSGTYSASLLYKNPGTRDLIVILRIEMLQPSQTVFCLAFEVERYFDQIASFAQSQYGLLWILPGPQSKEVTTVQGFDMPDLRAYSGQGFTLELPQKFITELHGVLDDWKRIK